LTLNEFLYLRDLKGLDDIHLGMLGPSTLVKKPEQVRDRLAAKGWIRLEPWEAPFDYCAHLTTRGLRAYKRQIHRWIDAAGRAES
jgi:hypothetical protein